MIKLKTYIKKRANYKPTFIVGGAHATFAPEVLKKHFDYIVKGDGEMAMQYIIKHKPSNKIISFDSPINGYPIPNRMLLDIKKYNYDLFGDGRTATLITSKGCNGQCKFCAGGESRNIRFRSLKNIFEEVAYLKSLGYNSLYFLDDSFTMNKTRAMKISKLLKPLHLKYRIEARANQLDYKILKELKNSGLEMIALGIEHMDDDVLERCNKNITTEQIMNVVDIAKELDIKVKGFFIINLPGATEQTALKSFDFAVKNLDMADFYPLTLYPGSEYWKNPKKYGIKLLSKKFKFGHASSDREIELNAITNGIRKKKVISFNYLFNKLFEVRKCKN